ncbi:MAG TPA: ABC transporter ATP-binding protein, partial [Burkholderiaceae bacterium]|nr:ABC transporter ATP-binding protein [Burkholderiaceae bacterium]
QGVLLVGDGVHVHVDDGAARSAVLAQALREAGVPCGPVETIEPTIEDLFVALLERKRKAA